MDYKDIQMGLSKEHFLRFHIEFMEILLRSSPDCEE